MELKEVEALLAKYKSDLEKLQPALHPGKSMAYTKLGLFNSAKHKEKKLQFNINFLSVAKNNPSKLTIETLREYLE